MSTTILDHAGNPLYEADVATMREAVEQAVQKHVSLRGADLWGANLRGTDLRGTDLRGTDLRYANLWGADLRGTDLRSTDLRYANLWGTDLRGANLRYADLRGARLSWKDHTLIAEILWQAADTESRQMLAAYVGRRTDWCWDDWRHWQHPDRAWAIGVLAGWAHEGDGAPDWILEEEAR